MFSTKGKPMTRDEYLANWLSSLSISIMVAVFAALLAVFWAQNFKPTKTAKTAAVVIVVTTCAISFALFGVGLHQLPV